MLATLQLPCNLPRYQVKFKENQKKLLRSCSGISRVSLARKMRFNFAAACEKMNTADRGTLKLELTNLLAVIPVQETKVFQASFLPEHSLPVTDNLAQLLQVHSVEIHDPLDKLQLQAL
jgi:hypothetical protein